MAVHVRGSIKINKNVTIANPSGTLPGIGKIAYSLNANGDLIWDFFKAPEVRPAYQYPSGSLVSSGNSLYYATHNNAPGNDVDDTAFWLKIEPGSQGTILTQAQIDAINGANQPSGVNPFATMDDISRLTIAGTDTSANILLKDPYTPDIIWISSDDGVDTFGNIVLAGDGMISNGGQWLGIGPIRGPKGDKGIQGDQGIQGPIGPGITVIGSAPVDDIITKDSTGPGDLWISTTVGTDSLGNPVDIGDGLVSDGTGNSPDDWRNVGPIQGPAGPQGPQGEGVPIGGTGSQILAKIDGADYNTEWKTLTPSMFSQQYIQSFTNETLITVAHILGNYPTVVCIEDGTDKVLSGVVTYTLPTSELTVEFSNPKSGKIICTR